MELSIILFLVIVGIVLATKLGRSSANTRKVFKDNAYSYTAKDLVMTRTEAEFFRKLDRLVQDRYYVFPQVHLSALLDHRVKGQDWKYAFRHINGKSVDFVLCDRDTLLPTYAIELDDDTHDAKDRQKRDREVERIFEEADLPLIRIRDSRISDSDLIGMLQNAFRS